MRKSKFTEAQIARRRRRSCAKYVRGQALQRATRPNEIWTMDFLSDRLLHGRSVGTMLFGSSTMTRP